MQAAARLALLREALAPDELARLLADDDGLGFRVPMLIISAYARKGVVSHVRYDHGSIMRFTEDQFGLARLALDDSPANSPEPDCFDFKQPPRKFVPIK